MCIVRGYGALCVPMCAPRSNQKAQVLLFVFNDFVYTHRRTPHHKAQQMVGALMFLHITLASPGLRSRYASASRKWRRPAMAHTHIQHSRDKRSNAHKVSSHDLCIWTFNFVQMGFHFRPFKSSSFNSPGHPLVSRCHGWAVDCSCAGPKSCRSAGSCSKQRQSRGGVPQ